jgi:DNA-binding response OmpR family regulator
MTKVLVFESDPSFAGELRTELGRLGATVQVVDDGNVGLQVAASDRPDLILLSIELPRMNGFSVCNKLKKDESLKHVPLVIMSSESSDETFEQHRKLRTRAED